MCLEAKPAADDEGHCSYECASGGGKVKTYVGTRETKGGRVDIERWNDGRLVFTGYGTFDCRENIKAASLAAGALACWSPEAKSWTVAAGTDLDAALPAPPPPPRQRTREEWTREEYQNWLIRHIHRKVFGPCCRNAVAYESRPYGPICYNCERHGRTINDYTGD